MSADPSPRKFPDNPGAESSVALRGELTINDLGKSFVIGGQPRPVLENINLTVRPGEFVSIVGASGCGKSTLLRLIVGLDDDYGGESPGRGARAGGAAAAR